MSDDQMKEAVKVKFDFGELHKTMADVKASVWRLDKCDDQVRTQRLKKEQQLFKMMAPGKTEERQAYHEKLKQGGFLQNISLKGTATETKEIDLGDDDQDRPDNYPFNDLIDEATAT
jgi:hypothetical protein